MSLASVISDLSTLSSKADGLYQQITSLVRQLTTVNSTITSAQNIIINDCSGIVHSNINTALAQSTTLATAAANAAIDSNPTIQQILTGSRVVDYSYGGGGSVCNCRCKYNKITRRKKRSKRRKTRVRRN